MSIHVRFFWIPFCYVFVVNDACSGSRVRLEYIIVGFDSGIILYFPCQLFIVSSPKY
jgi:hypothetical protein